MGYAVLRWCSVVCTMRSSFDSRVLVVRKLESTTRTVRRSSSQGWPWKRGHETSSFRNPGWTRRGGARDTAYAASHRVHTTSNLDGVHEGRGWVHVVGQRLRLPSFLSPSYSQKYEIQRLNREMRGG